MTQETQLISKISIKGVGAQPKKNSLAEGASEALCLFYGRVTGYTVGTSSFGEFVKFKGGFEAVNAKTGEVFKSSAILLPDVVNGMLQEAVEGADGNAVDFALEIGVKYSENAYGYEYTVKPLQQMRESDELAALRSMVAEKTTIALPAPAAPAGDKPASKAKAK